MGYMEVYEEWLSNPYFDEETKAELLAIKDDENEIKERFYMDLEFGTAGLRGVIGAGINRMIFMLSERQHRDLQIILRSRAAKIRALRLLMIQDVCPLNLRMKRHVHLRQTALRLIFLSH